MVLAKKKFEVGSTDIVTIVLEEDGTCVDEEEYFQHGLESNSVLMLLKSDETWTGISRSIFSSYWYAPCLKKCPTLSFAVTVPTPIGIKSGK